MRHAPVDQSKHLGAMRVVGSASVVILMFIPASAMLLFMTSLRQTGPGMLSARVGRTSRKAISCHW